MKCGFGEGASGVIYGCSVSLVAGLRHGQGQPARVETLHRQYRKISKARNAFPHDDALRKLLYLAHRAIAQKWKMPICN